jgi:hypothetical protein
VGRAAPRRERVGYDDLIPPFDRILATDGELIAGVFLGIDGS